MDAGELAGLSAEELMAKKDSIEAEIKAHQETLELQGGVGMRGALVDAEGFPRADIDVFAVRSARNKIICLRNDHEAVMVLIERRLHEIHAEARRKKSESGEEVGVAGGGASRQEAAPKGFVRVDSVLEGSPAATAGLREGDLVLEFGSVHTSNFSGLSNIATVVQHSQEVGGARGVVLAHHCTVHNYQFLPATSCTSPASLKLHGKLIIPSKHCSLQNYSGIPLLLKPWGPAWRSVEVSFNYEGFQCTKIYYDILC